MSDEINIQYLSQEKLQELQKELRECKEVKIPELAKRIDEARQLGDLSENAEYHAAREEMSWVQSRMKEVEYILDNAEVVDNQQSSVTIGIGSAIVVKVNGVIKEFSIVGPQEADPLQGKISNESPLGKAFLGKKKGQKVEVSVPSGVHIYEVVEIK